MWWHVVIVLVFAGSTFGQPGSSLPVVSQSTDGCGTPGTGDCLEANGSPYCENQACCEAVCALDSYCCVTEWDAECANLAVSLPDVCGGAEPNPQITVTSPNGGESWSAGTTQTITWSAVDTTGEEQVRVLLYEGNDYRELLGETTVGAGSLNWPISAWIGDGTTYRICVEMWVDTVGWVQDCGDAPFTITGSLAPPAVTLTSPNGGEAWQAGMSHTITWLSSGIDEDEWLTINLYDGETYRGQIGGTTIGAGSLDWSIAPWFGDGTNYRVCVEAYVSGFGAVQDCGDASFAVTGSLQPPVLTITSPNGGESWQAGTTHTITWTSTNTTGTEWATISLYEGGNHRADLGSVPLSNGSLDWQISPWIGDRTDYQIRIEVWVDAYGPVQDSSDAPFAITGSAGPPTLSLTNPNGGETWLAGTTQPITWTSTQVQGYEWVSVYLYSGDTYVRQIGGAVIGDGGMDWAIPSWIGDGTDYRVCLETWVGDFGAVTDCSDASFSLTGSMDPPTLTVTSPNGGEVWQAGTTQAITWTSTHTTGSEWLTIELYEGDQYCGSLGGTTVGSGGYDWAIPAWTANGDNYRLRIVFYQSSDVFEDFGDGPFEITGSAGNPTLTITSPNGGETWQAGSTQTITWSSNGIAGDSSITVSLYQGETYRMQIGSGPVGSGSLVWAIPAWIGDHTQYRVCTSIWLESVGQVEDCGDGFFSITGSTPPPAITLTSPNGGETWQAGTTHSITWTSANTTGDEWVSASLYASTEYIGEIGGTFAEAGSVAWQIPPWIGDRTDYRVRLSMSSGFEMFEDYSNGSFTITGSTPPPTITVVSPNGGESYQAGTTQTISWTSTHVSGQESANIELYAGDVPLGTIGTTQIGTGSFAWSIPPWIGDRADYRVRIALYDGGGLGTFEDDSNAPFTISDSTAPPTITVTSPDSASIWQAGTTQTVTWTSTHPHGWVMVTLQSEALESAGSPTVHNPLIIGLAPMEAGSFDWPICSSLPAGSNYRIEVMWMVDGNVRDETDGTFQITNPSPTTSPTMTQTFPQAGQAVQAGATTTINWTSTNPTGDVDIYLSHAQSSLHYDPNSVIRLGSAPMASGSFDWYVDPELGWDHASLILVNPSVGTILTEVQILPISPVFLAGAVSRRTHGTVGNFDTPLSLGGTAGSECRTGGPRTIVLTFSGPAEGVQVQASAGTVDAVTVDGPLATVELHGVPNATCLTLTASDVADMQDAAEVRIACLAGDVNGDQTVNIFDLVQVRNQLNQSVTASTCRADVNVDGAINIFDLVAVRNSLNSALICP